jgi:choline dehydrogenase-like flavoprotein
MADADVAIIGGGLAGSTAAAMLRRAGVRTMLVNPHPIYPPDRCCEKLDGRQVSIVRKTTGDDHQQISLSNGNIDIPIWLASPSMAAWGSSTSSANAVVCTKSLSLMRRWRPMLGPRARRGSPLSRPIPKPSLFPLLRTTPPREVPRPQY